MCPPVARKAVDSVNVDLRRVLEGSKLSTVQTSDAVSKFMSWDFDKESFKVKTANGGRERVFTELMQLMGQSSGRLYEDDLDHISTESTKDPQQRGLTTPRNQDNLDYLCTLLHQAVAGPAQETNKKDLTCPRECLLNSMVFHSAAIKGYNDTVAVR
ncbi:hypothetical protein ON010_g15047 [Phytophthora cinnamomi]|nr:hypothetical protein ON010_g15047 [Phytophthora cinnamomi]